MNVRENKKLFYDKTPLIGVDETEHEKITPSQCILEKFERVNDKLKLYFKNKSRAVIKAKIPEAGKDVDLIEKSIKDFIGKSYEEILNNNFK